MRGTDRASSTERTMARAAKTCLTCRGELDQEYSRTVRGTTPGQVCRTCTCVYERRSVPLSLLFDALSLTGTVEADIANTIVRECKSNNAS